MKLLGNIIWLVFGGFEAAVCWLIVGILWCITIIGIPVGLECFKAAGLVLWPFGKEVVYEGGAMSCLVNLLWLVFGGLALATAHFFIGIIYCITIIGIPFGMQHFKLAKLAFCPVGAKVQHIEE